jgi:AcrR family transcriptional regulator
LLSIGPRGEDVNVTTAATSSLDDLWADVRPDAARRLLVAALELFADRGYHATTTRDVAAAAGVSPGLLYVHFPTKADVLARISLDGHRLTLQAVTAALERAEPEPAARLASYVETFVSWHARHHVVARVVQYELAALPADAFAEVAALRRRTETLLRREIEAGLDDGSFSATDPATVARAVLSLGIDVARWYGTGSRGRPDPGDLGGQYAALALRMVGAG